MISIYKSLGHELGDIKFSKCEGFMMTEGREGRHKTHRIEKSDNEMQQEFKFTSINQFATVHCNEKNTQVNKNCSPVSIVYTRGHVTSQVME